MLPFGFGHLAVGVKKEPKIPGINLVFSICLKTAFLCISLHFSSKSCPRRFVIVKASFCCLRNKCFLYIPLDFSMVTSQLCILSRKLSKRSCSFCPEHKAFLMTPVGFFILSPVGLLPRVNQDHYFAKFPFN